MIDPLLTDEPVTDPLPLYRLRDGLMGVDLLAAAVSHLNLFTWLADHPATLGSLCAHFEIHIRPADVLMTLCSALDLVTQAGGVFHLTARAREHLVEGSPWCLKPYYDTLKKRPQTLEYLQVLKTGKPANWGSAHTAAWAQAMEDDAFADAFTAAMDCRGIVLAPALAKRVDLSAHRSLLDVAGGSGIYACALVARHPHLTAAVFERPPVDRIARKAIAKRGLTHQVDVIAGDMFECELPAGFDVILLSNVIHDWEDPVAEGLVSKAARALPSGGMLLLHDAFLDASKTGPLPVAMYSALLMHSTEGRCFSIAEMQTWLERNGLEWCGHYPSAVDRSVVVARKI
jgi:3-hydroxy-5-methyl-1-naphthoate 3-O-methyltransferase